MSNWPTVELVHPPDALDETTSQEVKVAASRLIEQGVPKEILNGRYSATEIVTEILVGGRSFLRFGGALNAAVCVDVSSGSVVTVMIEDSSVRFVNSSLEKFIETAVAVTSRFPYYGEDAAEAEVERAAGSVSEIVRSVEERALERDGFWAVLVDDIQMGDFATEWVICRR
jgi:hypothetical protein